MPCAVIRGSGDQRRCVGRLHTEKRSFNAILSFGIVKAHQAKVADFYWFILSRTVGQVFVFWFHTLVFSIGVSEAIRRFHGWNFRATRNPMTLPIIPQALGFHSPDHCL